MIGSGGRRAAAGQTTTSRWGPRRLGAVLLAATALGAAAPSEAARKPEPAAPAAPAHDEDAARPGADPYAVAAPPPPGLDRDDAARATRELLERLIALDTRNPPGNERLVADELARALADVEGVETHVLPVAEDETRANFVAILRAQQAKARPVLVMGHMDVVGVEEERWTTPPLQPTVQDGYLWGRGAMDCKGPLAAATVALRALASRRDELRRDVVLLATAAEEGGPAVGIDRVLAEHRELLGDVEFALNEGGRIRVEDGAIRTVNVQTTEKVYYTVVVRATGSSGHGSVPLPDNALAALSRACSRLHAYNAPLRLNETTRLYFERLASIEPDPRLRAAMEGIVSDDLDRVRPANLVLSAIPEYNAILRTAQALTMLAGGFRENVIPGAGSATFNVRVVPGDDVVAIVRDMERFADEDAVTVELDGEPKESPPPSPTDTALFAALEAAAAAMAPGALVVPFMSTGATDGAALRAAGIPTYGILPLPMTTEDELRMHGDDERVPLGSIGWATEFVYRTLSAVAE